MYLEAVISRYLFTVMPDKNPKVLRVWGRALPDHHPWSFAKDPSIYEPHTLFGYLARKDLLEQAKNATATSSVAKKAAQGQKRITSGPQQKPSKKKRVQ